MVGNALSRGQPVVEAMLDQGLTYTSGPEWLGHHILQDQWVLAVSGTHGKASTASMLAWILDCAGLKPGFLIGGVPGNFGVSPRLGRGRFFVVEADEYDSAFFDKRSKFVHYRPKTLVSTISSSITQTFLRISMPLKPSFIISCAASGQAHFLWAG